MSSLEGLEPSLVLKKLSHARSGAAPRRREGHCHPLDTKLLKLAQLVAVDAMLDSDLNESTRASRRAPAQLSVNNVRPDRLARENKKNQRNRRGNLSGEQRQA